MLLGPPPSSFWASQVVLVLTNLPANTGDIMGRQFDPWVGKIPWRRKWQPTLEVLPGESHGQRRLAGYRPWGREQSDMTEATQHALLPSKQSKSRGKPICLRCSLLSPPSMPCLQVEGRLSLTDGKPAAVLRLAAKWDRRGSDLMGCGIKLKVQNIDAQMKAVNGDPPEERVLFFTTEGTILKVWKREKTATG